MTANYRPADTATSECQRRQEARYQRLGQPHNAEAYRDVAAEGELLAARIEAVLSVERDRG